MHCSYLVSPLLYATFYDRIPSPGTVFCSFAHSITDTSVIKDLAAACIFLATKTEECGRKLRDVARVCQAKIHNTDVNNIPADGKVRTHFFAVRTRHNLYRKWSSVRMLYSLLKKYCWRHFVLILLSIAPIPILLTFSMLGQPKTRCRNMLGASHMIREHFSITRVRGFWDSSIYFRYRTPCCILYPAKIIAAACYVLAQRIYDGPNSPSLDARISATAPSMSLPTPPTHKPPSPDATRFAIEQFQLAEEDLSSVAGMMLLVRITPPLKACAISCASNTARFLRCSRLDCLSLSLCNSSGGCILKVCLQI